MSTSTRTAPPALPPHQLAPTTEQLRSAAFFVQNQWHSRQYPPVFPARPEDVRDGVVKTLRSCAWSRTGKYMAVGKEFKEIKVFDGSRVPLDTKSAVTLSMQPHNGHISALAFSPVDEDTLISGCRSASSGGKVVVWSVTNPIVSFTLGDIMSICFHPSGRQFLVSHSRSGRDEVTSFHLVSDGETEVWKERDDITLTSRAGTPYDEMNGIQFVNSGKAICGVSNDGTFSAWKFPLDPIPLSPELVVLEVDEDMDEDEADEASRKSTPRDATPEPDNDDAEAATAAEEVAGDDADVARDTAPDEGNDSKAAGDVDVATKAEDAGDAEVEGQTAAQDEDEGGVVDAEDALAAKPVGLEEVTETANAEETAIETAETAGEAETVVASADADVDMGEDVKDDQEAVIAAAPEGEGGPSEPKANTDIAQLEPNGDVDMADPVSDTAAPSVAPSRHPSPPPEKPKKRKLEVSKTKAKQLARVRRTVCSAASLQAVGLDPTGRFVAVAGFDSVVRLLDSRDWICQRTFNQSLGGIKQLSFSHDGELLAFGGDDQSVYIVSVISGELIAKYDSRAVINNLHWHPSKNWLAWTTSNKGIASLTAPLYLARME